MKIIYNKLIPFKGYIAMNLFGIFFVREEYKGRINERVLNHESIHTEQMKELLYLPFYILYILEWLLKLFVYISPSKAYRNISFEREAYKFERDFDYIKNRKRFSWLKYIWE